MKFTPKTEEEIQEKGLLKPGIYDFEIVKAEDTQSKKGNDMIKIVMKVFADDGSYILLSDYLLAAMEFKLKHCCEAIGISEKYATGDICADDFVSGTGKLKLKIDPGKPKDDGSGENYPDRNAVADYVPAPSKQVADNHGLKPAKKKAASSELDDEIPW